MQIVLITGASQGIGAAVAHAFARRPDTQLLLTARNAERLDQVAQSCRSAGAPTQVLPCDLTDADAVAALGEQVVRTWGAPHVLVNNAGRFQPGSLIETSSALFDEVLRVNLVSAFLVTRALLPAMLERGSGHVFFMASVASVQSHPSGGAYCVAKHGLLGLARSLREETKAQGIRVTTLLPGATWTSSWSGADIPESRMMPPEDIATALLSAYELSDRTVIEELLVRPARGDL